MSLFIVSWANWTRIWYGYSASDKDHDASTWFTPSCQRTDAVAVRPWQASDAAADLEKALAQEHRALGDFMITFHAVVREETLRETHALTASIVE